MWDHSCIAVLENGFGVESSLGNLCFSSLKRQVWCVCGVCVYMFYIFTCMCKCSSVSVELQEESVTFQKNNLQSLCCLINLYGNWFLSSLFCWCAVRVGTSMWVYRIYRVTSSSQRAFSLNHKRMWIRGFPVSSESPVSASQCRGYSHICSSLTLDQMLPSELSEFPVSASQGWGYRHKWSSLTLKELPAQRLKFSNFQIHLALLKYHIFLSLSS